METTAEFSDTNYNPKDIVEIVKEQIAVAASSEGLEVDVKSVEVWGLFHSHFCFTIRCLILLLA